MKEIAIICQKYLLNLKLFYIKSKYNVFMFPRGFSFFKLIRV